MATKKVPWLAPEKGHPCSFCKEQRRQINPDYVEDEPADENSYNKPYCCLCFSIVAVIMGSDEQGGNDDVCSWSGQEGINKHHGVFLSRMDCYQINHNTLLNFVNKKNPLDTIAGPASKTATGSEHLGEALIKPYESVSGEGCQYGNEACNHNSFEEFL